MRRHLGRIMFVSAAAASALALAATQALAATWTVSGGRNFSASGSATITITTDGGNSAFTCKTSTLSGTLRNGTGLSGTEIGHITDATFGSSANKCTGGGTGQLKPGTVWDINLTSYNSSTGTVTGTFADDGDGPPSGQVDFTFMFTNILGTCTFEAIGRSNFTYTISSGVLQVTGSGLSVSSASGGSACDGVDVGDPANYTGSYTFSGGHPVITSP